MKRWYHTTLESTLADTTFAMERYSTGKPLRRLINFHYRFAYQHGKWIFKSLSAKSRGDFIPPGIYEDDLFLPENIKWISF